MPGKWTIPAFWQNVFRVQMHAIRSFFLRVAFIGFCKLTLHIRDLHHGAGQLSLLWMWAKPKSWLWTSGRDTCGPTLLLWSVGDPCGEGKQLQVPRCKHLWGPDLDYTHSNTGLRKPVKDCTICDSWGNSGSHQQSLKLLFYSGTIESVLTPVKDCKALQRVVCISGCISPW